MTEIRIADWIVQKVTERGHEENQALVSLLHSNPSQVAYNVRANLPSFITQALLEDAARGVVHGNDFTVTANEVAEKLKRLDSEGNL